jgi:hypothetical protein
MGTTARQPRLNGSHANLLLPFKKGSEAVNWCQQGAEGHWDTHERGSNKYAPMCFYKPDTSSLTHPTCINMRNTTWFKSIDR